MSASEELPRAGGEEREEKRQRDHQGTAEGGVVHPEPSPTSSECDRSWVIDIWLWLSLLLTLVKVNLSTFHPLFLHSHYIPPQILTDWCGLSSWKYELRMKQVSARVGEGGPPLFRCLTLACYQSNFQLISYKRPFSPALIPPPPPSSFVQAVFASASWIKLLASCSFICMATSGGACSQPRCLITITFPFSRPWLFLIHSDR